ncbi:MAG: GIDE domain-containing protein [Pseudanabaenaceae cyanobacterium]
MKVSGLVRADHPLTAQLSTTPCVAYKCEVKWEYGQTKYYRINYDAEGREVPRYEANSPSDYYGSDRIETRTDVSKESIHADSKEIKFFVEDETSSVMINPASGSMKYVSTVNDYRSASGRDYLIQYGSFRKDVGYLFRNREKQTRGFEYKEEGQSELKCL